MSAGVAIVGCGLIGGKRAAALADARLLHCVDTIGGAAAALAARFGGEASSLEAALADPRVDAVIVAAINASLAPIATAALRSGKHVLVEKPAGLNAAETGRVIAARDASGKLVRVGFNHRQHPAFVRAREIVDSGALGPLLFLRARYGHGGRPGYDREWRADPLLSGGGELIDQGVHLIDLARWFLGDFPSVHGAAHTYFWDMAVDDNAFLLLHTAEGHAAQLHVSCSEWKNTFSFELYGRDGKLHIDGLGGSYGVERIAHYRMLSGMGPPETTIWEYPMADSSWDREFRAFLQDIATGTAPDASLEDAAAALTIVESVYRMSNHDHHA